MKKFKGISLLTALALSLTAFTSCKTISKSDKIHSDDPLGDGSVGSYITLPTTEPLQADTYPDYPVNVPEIDKQDTGTVYQAEECEYEGLNLASDRSGYSGEGYINGFNRDKNSLVFKVEAPSTQHYDIGFSIAADAALSCRVSVNNMYLGEFKTNSSGKFTLIKMYGIFLTKGEAVIEIKSDEGDIDLDYLQLTNNTNLSEISYEADGSLANENAAKNAKELMSFLTENYGKTIISGQYASDSTNKEQDFIYKIRGAIEAAYRQRDELNKIISQMDFGKDRYRFEITKNRGPDGKYYDMFMDRSLEVNPSQIADGMENQMNLFTMSHEDKYGDLMQELISVFIPPDNATAEELEESRHNMEKYADYRTYLSFDMQQIIKGEETIKIRLSRMIKKNSGGEGQNPLYVALLASFAQAYRVGLSPRMRMNPTIRLVVLDEAFSKMDAEKVASCIALIRGLGFQAIISATNDKIQNYIENVDKTFVFANPNKKHISIQEFEKKEFVQLQEELADEM